MKVILCPLTDFRGKIEKKNLFLNGRMRQICFVSILMTKIIVRIDGKTEWEDNILRPGICFIYIYAL